MEQIHAILVDGDGYKIDLYNVKANPMVDVAIAGTDHILIYDQLSTALPMLKPRWTGSTWEECATAEELAQKEAMKEQAQEIGPSQIEQLAVELSTAIATQQQEFHQSVAEMTLLIAAGMGVK